MSQFEVLGTRIRNLRTDRGLSQGEVVAQLAARGVEISQAYLSRIESSERTPAGDVIAGLAAVFNVSADYLLMRSDVETGYVGHLSDEAARVAGMIDAMDETTRQFTLGLVQYIYREHLTAREREAEHRSSVLDAIRALCGDEASETVERLLHHA